MLPRDASEMSTYEPPDDALVSSSFQPGLEFSWIREHTSKMAAGLISKPLSFRPAPFTRTGSVAVTRTSLQLRHALPEILILFFLLDHVQGQLLNFRQ